MAVINSMVKLMHDRKLISSPKEIKESILEREALFDNCDWRRRCSSSCAD